MTDTAQEKKFPVTEDIKEAMALIKRRHRHASR